MRRLLAEAAKRRIRCGRVQRQQHGANPVDHGGATETKSPVIIQASRGARAYSQDRFLYHLMIAATEVYPEIPTVLHLDHGNSVETCKSAIDMGFTSVMMDGSLMPDGETPFHLRLKRGSDPHGSLDSPHEGCYRGRRDRLRRRH